MDFVAAGASTRVISYSEVSSALDCWARWDFAYGGHLAGSALKAKTVAPILSGGRAFGAAIAALHASYSLHAPMHDADGLTPGQQALRALDASLDADAARQREHGVHDQASHDELRERLLSLILDYEAEAQDRIFPVDNLEGELLVPIPARHSARDSSKYRLLCYLDALAYEPLGYAGWWLVEYKLRGRLTSVEQIALSRQIRWYAYAFQKQTGRPIAGVLTVERLNEVPKPVRILKNGKPSHAKDQLCKPEAYVAACSEHDEDVKQDTLQALGTRRWQQIVPVQFREGELEEAGRELVSAAKLIHQLDTGELLPLRNPKAAHCNGCRFREICPSPDSDLVDALFERTIPKRDREDESHDRNQESSGTAAAGINF